MEIVEPTPIPGVNTLSTPIVANFKPSFKEKFTFRGESIASFLYAYKSYMDEATNQQKVKHIHSCLDSTDQEFMTPHLKECNTWEQVRTALIQEFGSNQTLANQKQVFMGI